MSKPYFFLISARGTLLNVHMPSSASAVKLSVCRLKSARMMAHKTFLSLICLPQESGLTGEDFRACFDPIRCLRLVMAQLAQCQAEPLEQLCIFRTGTGVP